MSHCHMCGIFNKKLIDNFIITINKEELNCSLSILTVTIDSKLSRLNVDAIIMSKTKWDSNQNQLITRQASVTNISDMSQICPQSVQKSPLRLT